MKKGKGRERNGKEKKIRQKINAKVEKKGNN